MKEEEEEKINYVFDEEDSNLFKINDLPLKGKAIQNYILPILENILLESISQINNIYEVEVFNENSTKSFAPNFREIRKTDNFRDWDFARFSLTGCRSSELWKGISKSSQKLIPFIPIYFSYFLNEDELSIKLHLNWYNQKNNEYFKYYQFIRDNLSHIIKMCKRAGAEFDIGNENIESIFLTNEEMLDEIIETKDYNLYFIDIFRSIELPVSEEEVNDLISSFITIFPLYDSLIKISLGEEPRFFELINTIKEKLLATSDEDDMYDDIEEEDFDDEEIEHSEAVADMVDKFSPKVGIRWQVFDRDNFRCVACGKSAHDGVELHIDHILPRSKGGKDELNNFQTLCNLCNLGKSNKSDKNLRRKK